MESNTNTLYQSQQQQTQGRFLIKLKPTKIMTTSSRSLSISKYTTQSQVPTQSRDQHLTNQNSQFHFKNSFYPKQPDQSFSQFTISPQKDKMQEYNSIYDKHLKAYFSNKRNYKQLVTSGLLRSNGVLKDDYEKRFARKELQQDHSDSYKQRRLEYFVNDKELVNSNNNHQKKKKRRKLLKSINLLQENSTSEVNSKSLYNDPEEITQENHNSSLPDIKMPSLDSSISLQDNGTIDGSLLKKLPKIDLKDKFIKFAYIKPQIKLNPYLVKSNFNPNSIGQSIKLQRQNRKRLPKSTSKITITDNSYEQMASLVKLRESNQYQTIKLSELSSPYNEKSFNNLL